MVILGPIDLGGDRVAAQTLRSEAPDHGPDRGAVGQRGIEPAPQAVFVQRERLPMVDPVKRGACRLGDDRAADRVLDRGLPDARQKQHTGTLVIAGRDEPRLLAPIRRLPLVPAIGRHQTAPMRESLAKVLAGCDRLRARVDLFQV